MLFCISTLDAFAVKWWVNDQNGIGNRIFHQGIHTDWEEMTQSTVDSHIFYLVKEININEDDVKEGPKTIYFKGGYDNESIFSSTKTFGFNGGSDNAYVKFAEAGTYQIVITIDDRQGTNENTSLDVIQTANVQGLMANGFSADWSVDKNIDEMTFNTTDNKYHLSKAITTSTDGEKLDYKIVTRHRDDTPNDPLGRVIYTPSDFYVAKAGNYIADFTFDPITKTASISSLTRYIDKTVTAEANYATFSCPFNAYVPEDATAYIITSRDGSTVNLTTDETTFVPATTTAGQKGTGIILEGAGTYRFTETSDAMTATIAGNLLCGTGDETLTISADQTWVFTKKASNVGFYKAIAGTYPKYSAFLLDVDIPATAREFITFDFGNESTTIEKITQSATRQEGQYYNLQGQPVANPSKGIYICNGKKVIIR